MKKYINRYENVKNEDKRILVGIDVIQTENGQVYKYGYYCGIELSLYDALSIENKKLLGIEDELLFLETYKKHQAIGIIYFPQTKTYGFLEQNDVVLHTSEELQSIIDMIAINSMNSSLDLGCVDPEDSLLELFDYPQKLERVSNR